MVTQVERGSYKDYTDHDWISINFDHMHHHQTLKEVSQRYNVNVNTAKIFKSQFKHKLGKHFWNQNKVLDLNDPVVKSVMGKIDNAVAQEPASSRLYLHYSSEFDL